MLRNETGFRAADLPDPERFHAPVVLRLRGENAKATLDVHRTARAAIEKDLAEVQGRLNRYKDQLMAVKTNKEYHAMQSEIATAESEVQAHEDRLLERRVEADDLAREQAELAPAPVAVAVPVRRSTRHGDGQRYSKSQRLSTSLQR